MSEDLTKKLPKSDSEKLSYVVAAVQDLTSRIQALDNKVEERLYDTRPIWEQVVANVSQLQEGQQRLEQRVEQLQEGQTQLQEGQQRLEQRVEQLLEGQTQLQEGQQRLEQRVEQLQEGQTQLQEGQQRLEQWVEQLQQGQTQLQEGQQRLEKSGNNELRDGYKRIEDKLEHFWIESRDVSRNFMQDSLRQMSSFFDSLLSVQANYHEINNRVSRLESKTT